MVCAKEKHMRPIYSQKSERDWSVYLREGVKESSWTRVVIYQTEKISSEAEDRGRTNSGSFMEKVSTGRISLFRRREEKVETKTNNSHQRKELIEGRDC